MSGDEWFMTGCWLIWLVENLLIMVKIGSLVINQLPSIVEEQKVKSLSETLSKPLVFEVWSQLNSEKKKLSEVVHIC